MTVGSTGWALTMRPHCGTAARLSGARGRHQPGRRTPGCRSRLSASAPSWCWRGHPACPAGTGNVAGRKWAHVHGDNAKRAGMAITLPHLCGRTNEQSMFIPSVNSATALTDGQVHRSADRGRKIDRQLKKFLEGRQWEGSGDGVPAVTLTFTTSSPSITLSLSKLSFRCSGHVLHFKSPSSPTM